MRNSAKELILSHALGNRILGQEVFTQTNIHIAASGNFHGILQGFRQVGKQVLHFFGAF